MFAALELSRKSWLVATNAPGEEKVSKRTIAAGDGHALLDLLAGLREKAERRIGAGYGRGCGGALGGTDRLAKTGFDLRAKGGPVR